MGAESIMDVSEMGNEPPQTPRRIVDRQLPIGVIVVLCIQIAGGIWWVSTQASNQRQTAEKVTAQEVRLDKIDDRTLNIEKSLAVLKDRSDEGLETSRRIEEYLHSNHR